MKFFFTRYLLLGLVAAVSLWFYFQISTYPYKVDRWFQPVEAGWGVLFVKHCSSSDSLLSFFVDHAVKAHRAYSAQAAFLDPEKKLSTCEIGYKDKVFGVRVDSTHRYRYASTTKLLTAVAILNLVNQKKLNLDDTLISFLPELVEFKDDRIRKITVEHLLSHRAGFNRLIPNGDPLFMRHNNKPWCPDNLTELQTFKLGFDPGKKQVYSNMGYCLLGEVIRRVTGVPYRDYVDREFSLSGRNIKFANNYYYNDEVRYDFRYEEWFNNSYLKMFDFNAISSAAGLSGSAAALAKLLKDIHGDAGDSPFLLRVSRYRCDIQKVDGCLSLGVNHYKPHEHGLALYYHQGYLPGSVSVAVVDSYGGVTVLLRSGSNLYQENPENEWIRWMYKRLTLYYTLQGKVTILNSTNKNNE